MTPRTAARLAGLLYLLLMVVAIFGEFYARGRLLVAGNAAQTARNIAAAETLFRFGIVSALVVVAGDVALLWALYVVLKPVNRTVALLAAFWRVAECAILAASALGDFVALRLLSNAGYLHVFSNEQLQALARLFLNVRHDSGQIGVVFLGLGSALFAWLWLKSRYIPRALAAWGVFSSLLLAIVTLVVMVVPRLASVVNPAYWVPIFIFEVTIGFWLLIKGVPEEKAWTG